MLFMSDPVQTYAASITRSHSIYRQSSLGVVHYTGVQGLFIFSRPCNHVNMLKTIQCQIYYLTKCASWDTVLSKSELSWAIIFKLSIEPHHSRIAPYNTIFFQLEPWWTNFHAQIEFFFTDGFYSPIKICTNHHHHHHHHYHHQHNVHFLPRLLKGMDRCFPTA